MKLTVPVKPPKGVMVMAYVAVWPADTLRDDGTGVMVNGAVTVTPAGVADVDTLLVALPL